MPAASAVAGWRAQWHGAGARMVGARKSSGALWRYGCCYDRCGDARNDVEYHAGMLASRDILTLAHTHQARRLRIVASSQRDRSSSARVQGSSGAAQPCVVWSGTTARGLCSNDHVSARSWAKAKRHAQRVSAHRSRMTMTPTTTVTGIEICRLCTYHD